MPDKITVNGSLSSLDTEGTPAAPYRFALNDNKIITFPNPLDLPFEEAEDLIQTVTDPATSITAAFEKWLSEEDYAKLRAARLSLRQIAALSKKVADHYSEIFGDAGN